MQMGRTYTDNTEEGVVLGAVGGCVGGGGGGYGCRYVDIGRDKHNREQRQAGKQADIQRDRPNKRTVTPQTRSQLKTYFYLTYAGRGGVGVVIPSFCCCCCLFKVFSRK